MSLPVSVAAALSAALLLAPSGFAAGRDQRVVEAAKRQDAQAVQALVKQGGDVNATQADGATALHWAVYWDDAPTVDLLIRSRANVNAANDLGVTPLFLACNNANGALVAKLLAAGANPNALVTPTGETLLMTAARTGSSDAVKALLARGAKVNATEMTHGQTALMWAVSNRHPAIVQLLIAAGADVHARTRVERIRVVVSNDRNKADTATEVDTGGSTPLLFAARVGDVDSGKLLLAAGANVNDAAPDKTSVLTFAAHSGQGAFAALLLEKGADPNAAESGYTPLHAAVLRGDAALVKALLARGADPNATVKRGTPANRNSKDFAFRPQWIGATPFWLAAKFAEPEIMRALVAGGADPHRTPTDGTPPLTAAAGVGAGFGAIYDRRGRWRSPLEWAAVGPDNYERQTMAAVEAVVAAGVDVNAATPEGDTAVHIATTTKQASVVKWLVEHGAKLDVQNKRGQTPLSIANTRTRGLAGEADIDTKMVETLRTLGATK